MEKVEVVIVGAGFAGLCAAIKLQEAGKTSFLVLERSTEVGGTWRDNEYPGSACDVPSHLYSYSFEPNTQWTRPYPQQPEIQSYILRVTEKYGLRPMIRFGVSVQKMQWLPERKLWQIDREGDTPLLAEHVILATGPLNKPSIPALPGLSMFTGPTFHSSQWRHDVDLRGKRVAVVGTGASAVQFVPEIADIAQQVTVFQRTAAWVLPRWDRPYGRVRRWAYRAVPGLQRLNRWRIYWFNELVGVGFMGVKWMQAMLKRMAMRHLSAQVPSQSLRAALTPNFNPGCKRLLISNTWFPALQKPQVKLVTSAVQEIRSSGVLDADGVEHPCDVIIWGTGFQATEFVAPIQIFGETTNGTALELGAHWRTQAAATHLGISVARFPNLFLLVGPNTGLGHNSIIFMIECQVDYVVQALQVKGAGGHQPLRLRPEVQTADYAQVQNDMKRTVWSSGCHSWYQNSQGNIDTLWPGYTWEYWLKTRKFNESLYL